MINIVRLYIAIDFDGTIVEDKYPEIGKIKKHVRSVLEDWYAQGHRIIIYSCREGTNALAAEDFLVLEGIPYHYFNENHPDLVEKYGNDCRKIGADIYIDDKSLFATGENLDWLNISQAVAKIERAKRKGSNSHGS